jgi:site-specific recombinase XerD
VLTFVLTFSGRFEEGALVTVSVTEVPVITIFVRHSADCKYRDDETWKRCNCRKHLRWTQGGKQFRRSAKTRSWTQAETNKRLLEAKFSAIAGKPVGDVRLQAESRKTIEQAVQIFVKDRRNEGRGPDVIAKYERELGRLETFMSRRSKFFPAEIDADDLTEFISDWTTQYPSSVTRNRVLTRLRAFLRYCYNRKWTDRIPQTVAIKPKKSETLPLEPAQYAKLLDAIPKVFKPERAKKAHALIQLMRWSGLAIRDAVTMEREEIEKDSKGNYRVITTRTKTKTHVNVRIPLDVAEEILAVANGNPQYLFWNSGQGTERTITTDWSDELRKLFRASGLPKGHPHQLRDTFAVELLKNGIPLEEVSRALGHDSIKTTEKYYAKWVKARQDRLDDLIAGTWKAQRKELSEVRKEDQG